jgi:hypothetical protein
MKECCCKSFTVEIGSRGPGWETVGLLYQEGISAATIFPGFKGVVEAMKEVKYWDRPERVNYWLYQAGAKKGW